VKEIKFEWYILYTAPRAEKRVKERLAALGVECYLPLHSVRRRWSDRMKVVEVPLFSSYIFVRCHESRLSSFLMLSGVVRIVYYEGRAAKISQEEIVSIDRFLGLIKYNEVVKVGDKVEIVSGPFQMKEAIVLEINGNNVTLTLKELGAKYISTLSHVEKIE